MRDSKRESALRRTDSSFNLETSGHSLSKQSFSEGRAWFDRALESVGIAVRVPRTCVSIVSRAEARYSR